MSATANAVTDAALQIGNCLPPGSEDDTCVRELPMHHGPALTVPVRGLRHTPRRWRSPKLPWRALRKNFAPSTAPTGEGLRQEWQSLRDHVGLEDPRGRSLIVCVFAKCSHKPRKTRHAPPQAACDLLLRSSREQAFEARTAARSPSVELRLQSLLHLAHHPAHPQRPHAQQQLVLQPVPVSAGSAPRALEAPRVRCGCGALVDPPPGSSGPNFLQHAQKCPQLAAARSARHNTLCGAWCQVMQSVGVPTSMEPNCSKIAEALIPAPPLMPGLKS